MRDTQWDIEPLVQEAVMALRSELREADASGLSILIDPTLENPLGADTETQQALGSGAATRVGVPSIHSDIDPERAPYLIHIGNEERAERLVSESLRIGVAEATGAWGPEYRGRSLCAWFPADANPQSLARRLAGTARVRRPDGSFWPLRLWDPRVLWHMPRVLDVQQRECVRQIAQRWLVIDPRGQLQSADELAGAHTDTAPAALPLRFDAAAWAALERIGAINSLLGMARDWGLERSRELAARIDRLLLRCQERGYLTEQDGLVFAATALTSHEQFDFHPAVNEVLASGARRNLPLAEVLVGFDDAFWTELGRGRWLQPDSGIESPIRKA